jgi:hypothetical protein
MSNDVPKRSLKKPVSDLVPQGEPGTGSLSAFAKVTKVAVPALVSQQTNEGAAKPTKAAPAEQEQDPITN